MSWLGFAPVMLVGVAILAVLGAPAALALRLRGFAAVFATVPAAFAVLALSSLALGVVGVPFGPLSALVSAIALATVLFIVRRWLGTPVAPRSPGQRLWLSLGSASVGGLIIAWQLVRGIKFPEAISQTYDAIFHLNAVQFVLETENASPLAMTMVTGPDMSGFYPTLWHGFVALIVSLTGASIPLATNAAVFVTASVVWPIGMVAFTQAIVGPSRTATLLAGLFLTGFSAFPLMLVHFGVLYPNLLSTALLAYPLAVLLALLRLGPARRALPLSTTTLWVLLLGSLGAATLAHPNSLFAFMFIAFPALIAATIRLLRARFSALRLIATVVGLLAFLLTAVALWQTGTTSDNGWEGDTLFREAVGDALGNATRMPGDALLLTALVLIGALLLLLRRSNRWLLVSYAVAIAAYGLARGMPESEWRTALIGAWYNDSFRLAALLPVLAIPLAVLAATAFTAMFRVGLKRFATQRSGSSGPRVTRRWRWATAALALTALAGALQGPGIYNEISELNWRYNDIENPKLLSFPERELLEALPGLVPEDALIIGNPWNGSSLAYALADRHVVFPHTGGVYSETEFRAAELLRFGSVDACESAKELGVTHVLDFGTDYVFPDTPRAEPFDGVTSVDDSHVLTEIAAEEGAALYEITGCSVS